MFGVIIFTIVYNLFRKEIISQFKVILVSLPAALYFLLFYLNSVLQGGFSNYSTNIASTLASWNGFASYPSMLLSVARFVSILFLVSATIGFDKSVGLRNLQLGSWLLFSLILMLFASRFC